MASKGFVTINDLTKTVEQICKCKASYLDQVAVIEEYGSNTVSEGIVHVFRITGHPRTDTCHAWSSPIEGTTTRRYYAVLKIPPLDSPEKAVRASIVHDYKGGRP